MCVGRAGLRDAKEELYQHLLCASPDFLGLISPEGFGQLFQTQLQLQCPPPCGLTHFRQRKPGSALPHARAARSYPLPQDVPTGTKA